MIVADDGDDVDSDPNTDRTIDEDGDGQGDDDDEDRLLLAIQQDYDLAIDKNLVIAGNALPGDFVEFEIIITNEGTVDANNIIVEDEHSEGLIFVTSDVSENLNVTQLTESTYEILSLRSGGDESFVVVYQVDPSFEGTSVTNDVQIIHCLLYTSASPRDQRGSRMPSSA